MWFLATLTLQRWNPMKLYPYDFSFLYRYRCCCLCVQKRQRRKNLWSSFWIWVKADKLLSLFAYIWLDYGISSLFLPTPFTLDSHCFQLPTPPALTSNNSSTHRLFDVWKVLLLLKKLETAREWQKRHNKNNCEQLSTWTSFGKWKIAEDD